MAPKMQVDAFRGHVGADQQAHRPLAVAECIHDLLLIDVAHGAMQDAHLRLLQLEVAHQALAEPLQRFDPFREDHESVVPVSPVPLKRVLADRCQEGLIATAALPVDALQLGAQFLQRPDLIARSLPVALPGTQSLVHRLQARSRARKQTLLQAHGEKVPSAARGSPALGAHLQQRLERLFLERAALERQRMDLAVPKRLRDLTLNVLLEPAYHQPFPAKVLAAVIVRIGDCRRIQHVHQAREAARLAIVRRGRKHDQRVRAAGQPLGQTASLRSRAAIRNVVGLVDDDDVPVRGFQERSVLLDLLERVD